MKRYKRVELSKLKQNKKKKYVIIIDDKEYAVTGNSYCKLFIVRSQSRLIIATISNKQSDDIQNIISMITQPQSFQDDVH